MTGNADGLLRKLGPANYKSMPWRNGGGVTTELASMPGRGDRFLWRISIATVDRSGPFSLFDGYDRVITLLSGAGMELSFSGERPPARLAEPLRPFPFSGDWQTECRLIGGTVMDFNVIFDRAEATARVTAVNELTGTRIHMVEGETAFVYVVKGALSCRLSDASAISLSAGESLQASRRRAGETMAVMAEGPASALIVDLGAK